MSTICALSNENAGFLNKFGEHFIACFSNFYIKDAIDIILLGLFFFFAFRFVKGRKAGVLFLGILIFFIVYKLLIIDFNTKFRPVDYPSQTLQ